MEERMMAEKMTEGNPYLHKLFNIYRVMGNHTFGYREAAAIIGSRAQLDKLIGQGRVRAEKKSNAQQGKIYCNAGDVLRFAKFVI